MTELMAFNADITFALSDESFAVFCRADEEEDVLVEETG